MTSSAPTSFTQRLRLSALLCAATVLGCLFLGRPFAETGFCDDFSYVYTAQHIAATGHMAYVGWAAAMLGWQVYAAAALFHLFGFSFTVARSVTWVSAMGVAFLLQRTLRRCGLTERNAVIATLAFTLSPVFLTLSASFMTDVEGLFAILVCLYCCVRALQASTARGAMVWIVAAVGTNAVLGTCRQVAWLGVLLIVPCTLWLLRARRQVMLAGAAMVAAAGVFILLAMHWFHQQPYTMTNAVAQGLLPASRAALFAHVFREAIAAGLQLPLILLPLAAVFLPQLFRNGRRTAIAAVVIAVVYALLAFHWRYSRPDYVLEPTIRDWMGLYGYLQASSPGGHGPILLPLPAQALLTLLAVGGAGGFLITLVTGRKNATSHVISRTALSWTQILILLAPFTAVYGMLLYSFAVTQIFERYVIELLLLPAIALPRLYQERVDGRLPTAGVAMLCVAAAYSVSCVHNCFAMLRAELMLQQRLPTSGLSEKEVDFGWAFDGWLELQRFGHMNNPAIRPAREFVPVPVTVDPACYTPLVPFRYLQPRYGVSYDPSFCSGQAPIPPVTYRTWPTGQLTPLYLVQYTPIQTQ